MAIPGRRAAMTGLGADRRSLERALVIEGVYNARDVGGWATADAGRVRTGQLYRSASLDAIADHGLAQLEALGVRTVVDLRSYAEVDRHGRFPHERSSIAWVHLPSSLGPPAGPQTAADLERLRMILSHPDPMSGIYREIVSEGSAMLGLALRLLADGTCLPALFHCTSGKDRTGILAVLIHLIVGVPLDDALVDFEMSAEALATVRNDMAARYPEMAGPAARRDRAYGRCRSTLGARGTRSRRCPR